MALWLVLKSSVNTTACAETKEATESAPIDPTVRSVLSFIIFMRVLEPAAPTFVGNRAVGFSLGAHKVRFRA